MKDLYAFWIKEILADSRKKLREAEAVHKSLVPGGWYANQIFKLIKARRKVVKVWEEAE
jgi:hypothetical protein